MDNTQRLAERFGELLLAELGQERYDELCKLNQEDPLVEHLTAFCDPNVAMLEAYGDVFGEHKYMEAARSSWPPEIVIAAWGRWRKGPPEPRWPICPECQGNLETAITKPGQLILASRCPHCELTFGEEVWEE
jgi:hypothetical protein